MSTTLNNDNTIKQIIPTQILVVSKEKPTEEQDKTKLLIRIFSSPLFKVYLLFLFVFLIKFSLFLNFFFTKDAVFIDPTKILIDPFVICKYGIENSLDVSKTRIKELNDDSQVKSCFDNVNYLKEKCLIYVYEYKSCQYEMKMCKDIEEDLRICNIYNVSMDLVKFLPESKSETESKN